MSMPSTWQDDMNFDFTEDGEPVERTSRSKRSTDDEEYEADEEFSFAEDVMSLTSELTRKERIAVGHNLTSMLIGCTFMGMKCKAR